MRRLAAIFLLAALVVGCAPPGEPQGIYVPAGYMLPPDLPDRIALPDLKERMQAVRSVAIFIRESWIVDKATMARLLKAAEK